MMQAHIPLAGEWTGKLLRLVEDKKGLDKAKEVLDWLREAEQDVPVAAFKKIVKAMIREVRCKAPASDMQGTCQCP
eukprot:2181012-Prorocentrum_lima.AAC.1